VLSTGDDTIKKSANSNRRAQLIEHKIPWAILVHILSYVDAETLVNMRLVCHWQTFY